MTAPLLVFDLDGTLAETAGDLIRTLNYILSREGIAPVPLAEGRKLVGQGSRVLIKDGFARAGRDLDPDRLEQLFRDFLAWYEEHIAVESHLFEGVVAALDRFEAAGWAFAVCTNKVEHPSVRLLTELGIAGRFRAICGQDTFRDGDRMIAKPDPRHLLKTIEKAGGDPARAVMVGDSRFDIEAAQRAHVPVVAVDFGYTDESVRAFNPDRIIAHYDQLWEAATGLLPVRAP